MSERLLRTDPEPGLSLLGNDTTTTATISISRPKTSSTTNTVLEGPCVCQRFDSDPETFCLFPTDWGPSALPLQEENCGRGQKTELQEVTWASFLSAVSRGPRVGPAELHSHCALLVTTSPSLLLGVLGSWS